MFLIEELIKEYRLSLGNSIKDRKKIYLDTKYWAYLCDIVLEKNTDKTLIDIYEKLFQLIRDKKIICPLSYRLYIELFKQKDYTRLIKTADIMEQLSENTMILFEIERLNYELLYFLYKTTKPNYDIYETDIFVWTKASMVLGAVIPESNNLFTEKENDYIKKEFFKLMWDYPFSSMIKELKNQDMSMIQTITEDTILSINRDKIKFEHELKNQQYVYMSELSGMLEGNKDYIKETFSYFTTKETSSNVQIGNNSKDNIQPIINMIYNLFKHNKMDKYLPTYNIKAKMFSSIRWNKGQKFKVNDLDDIGHIATALPYYDYFFTEKSFSNLIKQVKYDTKYNCNVNWEKHKVLESLNSI